MSPPPSLDTVSAGLPALDSLLLAVGLIDDVCLGLSSSSLGCLSTLVCMVAWYALVGLSLCLPHSADCLSTILLPWLSVVTVSSYGEYLWSWFSQLVVIM